jgi:TRAP-type C4-dicarboxylate transport system permease small subunit
MFWRNCQSQELTTMPLKRTVINTLNAELNPICCLLALLGAHHFLHVSRIRVKSLTLGLLMSYIYIYIYIYMEHLFLMFLDHTQRHTSVGRTPLDE